MITEIRQSRTSLLRTSKRHARRRHHTLDNATLDQFNFICIPLHINETRVDSPLSQFNSINTSSNEVVSPVRRVRFKFDENQHIHPSDDVQLPKKYSIHRVEFQIPIHQNINSYLNVDCSSKPFKTRSITSKKIDINHNNSIHQQGVISFNDSPIVRKDKKKRIPITSSKDLSIRDRLCIERLDDIVTFYC